MSSKKTYRDLVYNSVSCFGHREDWSERGWFTELYSLTGESVPKELLEEIIFDLDDRRLLSDEVLELLSNPPEAKS